MANQAGNWDDGVAKISARISAIAQRKSMGFWPYEPKFTPSYQVYFRFGKYSVLWAWQRAIRHDVTNFGPKSILFGGRCAPRDSNPRNWPGTVIPGSTPNIVPKMVWFGSVVPEIRHFKIGNNFDLTQILSSLPLSTGVTQHHNNIQIEMANLLLVRVSICAVTIL